MRIHFKKYHFIASFLFAALLLSFLPANAYSTPTGSYADYELTDGFRYTAAMNYDSSWTRTVDYTIENTPGSTVTPIVFSGDTIYGGYTVSNAVNYMEKLGYNVVAAVNSDFFHLSSGTPLGIVIEDGIIKSGFGWENALYFTSDGSAHIAKKPWITFAIKNTTEGERYGKEAATVNYNKLRGSSGLWLYSQYFSTVSTRTTQEGWMIRFKILTGEMKLGSTLKLQVDNIYEDTTSQKIGNGYLILTAQEAADMGYVLDYFAIGDICDLTIKCYDSGLTEATYACGCGDILLEDGKMTDSSAWDKDLAGIKAPRTALGIREDGTIVTYVQDGRSSLSAGCTMKDLAQELLDKGCVSAVNLDGGGSSALALRLPGSTSTAVQNIPSDGKERSCATYILFVTKEKSTGEAAALSLQQNGKWLLAGSSLPLTVTACDNALKKANVPDNITILPYTGEMQGMTYVSSPSYTGSVPIALESESGAKGIATLWVTDALSSFTVKNSATKKSISSATLSPGETLSLTYSGTYLKNAVTISPSCVTWNCDESIGTITEDGLFTASHNYGASGNITVSAGGKTVTIAVDIPPHFEDMEDHWALDYVGRLYTEGYIAGTSATTFSPDTSISRAALMCMVYNAAGKPAVTYEDTFPDVKDDMWYTDAVIWAYQQGITAGYSDGCFHPSESVSNQQAWTFMKNALGILGYSGDSSYDESVLSTYSDCGEVKDYAVAGASYFAANGGITLGENDLLCPGEPISRAAVAKLLCYGIWGE